MVKPELAALFETIASLELADDSLIDPDFSVSLMEQIAFVLGPLSEERRREFARASAEYAAQCSAPSRANLIRSIPESLGLAR